MAAILSPGRFFGSVQGRRTSGPFLLVETRYHGMQRLPPHRHDRPYFCFVVRGGYRERSTGREIACRPDTVVFHPGGTTHEDRFGEFGGTCFNLECESSWLSDRDTGLESLDAPWYSRDGYTAWLTGRLLHEARAVAGHSDLAIDGLARALVAAVAVRAVAPKADVPEPEGPAWLMEAVGLAATEYAGSMGLADVARRVGVSPRHLARAFRDRMGCTMGEYVRRRRVEAACRLLVESRDSLSRIAFRTGFADQSHLTRVFKRHVGTTPSDYRRRHRPGRSGSSSRH